MTHRILTLTALTTALLTLGFATSIRAADFAPFNTLTTNVGATDPTAVASGDLNGDNIPDLVVANNGSGQVSIFLGQAGNLGTFGAAANVDVGINGTASARRPASVAIGDVVGDSNPDIVVAVAGDDRVTILTGDGTGVFTSGTNINLVTGNDPRSVTLGDVDNDTDLDIIVANFNAQVPVGGGDTVSVLVNDNGADTFSEPNGPFAANTRPFAVTFGDANDDTIPDIVVTNFNSTTVSILAGANDGTFAAPATVTVGAAPHGVTIGDPNGDGHPDLAVANSGDGTVSVVLADTMGGFNAQVTYTVGASPRAVAFRDIDDVSTDLDLVVVSATGNNISVLPGNGTGAFTNASATTDFAAGTAPTSLAVADFDGDLNLDVAVANEGAGSNSATVLINDKQPTPADDLTLKVINGASNVPLDVLANDVDPDAGDTLTITAVSTGTATINGTSDGLIYTPVVTDNTENFTYTVQDQFGYTQTANVTVTMAANQAPSFTSSTVTAATEDAVYTYNITVTAPEAGDTLAITATTKPTWLTLTDNGDGTATLTGTPTNADVGSNPVALLVTDAGTLTGTQPFNIAVANTNDAPTGLALSPLAIDENSANNTVVGTLTTTDQDVGDTFTYSFVAPNSNGGGAFTIVGTQVQVANSSLLNFEATPTISITVRSTDSGSLTFDQNFTISLSDVNEAPVPTAPAITTNEDTAGTSQIAPNDPDTGDTHTYAVTTQGTKGSASVSASGLVTYTPTTNLNGADSVIVTVTDSGTGNLSAPVTVSVNITAANDPPVAVGTIAAQSGTEGTAFGPLNVAGNFADPDSTLTYSITGLPAGTGLSIDSASAVISGTPSDADAKASQPISVTVSATDGGTPASQLFDLTVSDINNAPAFTSTAVTSATQDVAYNYAVTTSDADTGDTLTITSGALPGWLTLTDNGNGTATLSGTPTNADVDSPSITLTVSDGTASTDQTFTLTVDNVNDAPTVTSGGIILLQDATGTVQVNVSDPDVGDTFTYAVSQQTTTVGGTASVDASGLVTYDATGASAGTDGIQITVTDQAGAGIAVAVSIPVTVNATGEVDSNNDGVTDAQAIALGLDPDVVGGDTDGDGIPDANEIGDPNNATDTDGDGVIDALEAGATASDASTANGVQLDDGSTAQIVSTGQTLSNVAAGPATGAPAGISFPTGTISYTTTSAVGGSVTTRLTFSADLPSNMALYKVDSGGTYTVLSTSLWTKVDARTLDVTLTDGDPATDLDGIANGSIDDPVAIASLPAPTSSSSGGGGGCTLSSNTTGKDPLMPALMLTAGVWLSRRRRQVSKR